MSVRKYEIIIFGAGINGLSLAIKLKQLGFESIALISKNALRKTAKKSHLSANLKIQDLRVSALCTSSVRYLQSLGLAEQFHQFAHFFNQMTVVDEYRNLDLNISDTDFNPQYLLKNTKNQNSLGLVIANSYLEQSLEKRVFELGIDFFQMDSELVKIDINNNEVQIISDKEHLTADLIVASDGLNSKIREISGIEIKKYKYKQKALVCYLKVSKPIKNMAWQCFMGSKTLALLPCFESFDEKIQNYHYSVVWTMDESEFEKNSQTIKTQIQTLTQNQFGEVLDVSKIASFDLTKSQVEDYAGNRVFLIGDAAHTIHPLAGMGLNLGLKDSKNLAHHLQHLKQKNLNIYEYQNLVSVAKQRMFDNEFSQNLMDAFMFFYNSKIPKLLGSFNRFNFVKKSPQFIKDKIIRFIEGFN